MATPNVKITLIKDGVPALMKALQQFEAEKVLVGIPASGAARSNSGGDEITNATIGAIMEHGSPAANIPARPWLRPGIASAKSRIVKRYEGAAKKALKGDLGALEAVNHVVGQETADAVKKYISHAPFAPLKPATIAARARQRGTMRRRKGEKEYLGLVRMGMLPGMAELAAGIRPLINTHQFVNSITYVVVKKDFVGPLLPQSFMQPISLGKGVSLGRSTTSSARSLGGAEAAEGGAEAATGAVEGVAEAAALVAL